MNWRGVLPAITTPFTEDYEVDHDFLHRHVRILIDAGSIGIVPLGSLGEGATLSYAEKLAILKTCVKAAGDDASVAPGISSLSTAEACQLARDARDVGCRGLMVLPPYVYSTDWREMKAHVAAVMRATDLSCMLYNNPLAYETDFVPDQVAELGARRFCRRLRWLPRGFPAWTVAYSYLRDLRRSGVPHRRSCLVSCFAHQ